MLMQWDKYKNDAAKELSIGSIALIGHIATHRNRDTKNTQNAFLCKTTKSNHKPNFIAIFKE